MCPSCALPCTPVPCALPCTPVPRGCKPEMNMMYAGSKLSLVSKVAVVKEVVVVVRVVVVVMVVVVMVTMALQVGLQHVFEVRELEELTEDWLTGKLAKS